MSTKNSLKIYSHSTLLYWWPIWLSSLALGIWTVVLGETKQVGDDEILILASATPGFMFMVLLLTVSVITTVTMKGLQSVVLVLSIAVALLIAAYFGVIDDFFRLIPQFSIHLSAGFYLSLGIGLFALWFLVVLFFDRLSYWEVTEGQLVRVKVIGAAEKAYDARGLTVEHLADDLLRNVVFGAGTGDIILRTSGAENATVPLKNVLFVDSKIQTIQRLVGIEPDG